MSKKIVSAVEVSNALKDIGKRHPTLRQRKKMRDKLRNSK